MPDIQINITEEDHAILERVRVQHGLDTIEQAAEWLAKSRLRRQAKQATGRGRALYLTGKGERA